MKNKFCTVSGDLVDQEWRIHADSKLHVPQHAGGGGTTEEGAGPVYDGHRGELSPML